VITGLSYGDTIGRPWWVTVHPDDKAGCIAAWQRFIDSSNSVFSEEVRMVRPDGKEVWAHVQASEISTLDNQGAVGTISDITDRKVMLSKLLKLR
jgi:PAS domain S-box-containing protein